MSRSLSFTHIQGFYFRNHAGAATEGRPYSDSLTLVCSSGEAGDDRNEFGGVDGFGKMKLEAGAKDAHAVFGTCIGREGGGGDLAATL